jgi:hypothetical protein
VVAGVFPEEVTPDAEAAEGKACKLPGCPGTVPPDAANRREFCDEHTGRDAAARRRRKEWMKEHGPANGDTPPKIAVQIGTGGTKGKARGGAKAEELAAVEERALQICQLTAALVMVATKAPHNLADAADISAASPAIAAATKELAVYEPWLRKLAAGGEVSGRATAWLGMLFALATAASPILVRHEVIKGGVAELASTILANGAALRDTDAAAA